MFFAFNCPRGYSVNQTTGWKPYGTPLVSLISCDDVITRGDIQKMVHTILSPLRRSQNLENVVVSDTSISATTLATEPHDDTSSGKACTESNASCSEKNDVTSSKAVSLPLQLVDEKNASIDLSEGEDKTVKISSSSMSIVLYIDWSQKLAENYDTHFLENLPEVFKYGPVTKKARSEPLSLYTCLEAFLREEPLVPEDMWLVSSPFSIFPPSLFSLNCWFPKPIL